jgi:hypothetical protein
MTTFSLLATVATSQGANWPTKAERDAAAKELGLGESAPDWLVQAETYAMYYEPADWGAMAASKISFITHCPANREFIERAHALGIRSFPYVSFYQAYAGRPFMGLNLKDHPEFIEVDAQGNRVRTAFWESEDAKNLYTTCPAVPEYQDAMVAYIRKVMELGADGVFLDNLGKREPCFGPKFGKHKHVVDDPNEAFALLLKKVRETIKRYKPDGALLGNSANPASLPREFWQHLDAEMLESYICTWVSKERWMDWKTRWHEQGVKFQPFLKAGKQIQALSYVGHTPYGAREDGFFCYATARLAGFVWSPGRPISDPETAILYQVQLGPPLESEREQSGLYYRLFERGFVVVNPDKEKPAVFKLPSAVDCSRLWDLFADPRDLWETHGNSSVMISRTVARSGWRCLQFTNASATESSGASRSVELNQTTPRVLVASGWSRAESVAGPTHGDYSIGLTLIYADGTQKNQVAAFAPGTHGWEQRAVTIQPDKPVKRAIVSVLFQGRTGTVWFDDLSLRETDENSSDVEWLTNPGFEIVPGNGRLLEIAADRQVTIPAYSGRVFLYAPDFSDELQKSGPTLTVVTEPPLGNVRFRVDGFDYWTHSGRWTTEFVFGPDFGRFHVAFDQPGRHTIEIVDVVPADMKTLAGYSRGKRLGEFMDPSQPTQPSGGKKFRFREWADSKAGRQTQMELEVKENTEVKALFDVEVPAKN